MLFIDGTVKFPTTNISKDLVAIVTNPKYNYPEKDLHYFDLKQDSEIRPALLEYSKYKITPQLYVKGKLVGGLDIVNELHEQNKLHEALERGPEDEGISPGINRFSMKLKQMRTNAKI